MVKISQQAALCTYKRNCGRFFPRQQLISNPVVLSVKSIYTEPFSLVMVVLGWKMCGQTQKAWDSNRAHSQVKLSTVYHTENHRDLTPI